VIALGALDRTQQAAVEHPLDDASVAITGPAGTGKSVALAMRADRARAALRPGEVALVTAPGMQGVARLRATIGEAVSDPRVVCAPLGDVAFELLCEHRFEGERSADLDLIDDARAAEIFERAGAELFALEWTEFVSAEVDPEVTGMRVPERFAAAAFRLIRKLRIADISPAAFAAAGLRGATAFYGRPPNLMSLDLIERTPQKYRDSLLVDGAELARQREREIDLVKVIGRLYRTYLDLLVAGGCLTRVDALVEARALLERRADVRDRSRARFRYALVDDAQDLNEAEARFLGEVFPALERVTLAGDPQQRTLGFAGKRAEGILDRASHAFALDEQHRSTPGIVVAARRILAPNGALVPNAPEVVLYRADDVEREAAFVALRVAEALASGTPPSEIAIITRSLRCCDTYVAALLERGIAVDPGGEGTPYGFAPIEDALAPLWALADPYRHDWLLRNLEAPWLRLSDATIATLCGEPADAQTLLFDVSNDAEDERGRRWERHRSLRLGRNVVRGDRDGELSPESLERLRAFREARLRWAGLERRLDLAPLARAVFAETVLAATGHDARTRFAAAMVERLATEIERFARREPCASLLDFLLHAERSAESDDDLQRIEQVDRRAVALLDVEAAKGREFAHVFVVDVRAGAFPRYYVPDAFLFTPLHGMIPKENVGAAASAARTAKFTYLQHRLDLRTKYNVEERRALYCAATRARVRLTISASGRATKGVAAPEMLEELRCGVAPCN
jgi:superfamily I DNA/RNA helicase